MLTCSGDVCDQLDLGVVRSLLAIARVASVAAYDSVAGLASPVGHGSTSAVGSQVIPDVLASGG